MQWPFLRSKAGLAPTSERHAPKQAHTSYRKRVARKDQLQQNTLCKRPLSANEVGSKSRRGRSGARKELLQRDHGTTCRVPVQGQPFTPQTDLQAHPGGHAVKEAVEVERAENEGLVVNVVHRGTSALGVDNVVLEVVELAEGWSSPLSSCCGSCQIPISSVGAQGKLAGTGGGGPKGPPDGERGGHVHWGALGCQQHWELSRDGCHTDVPVGEREREVRARLLVALRRPGPLELATSVENSLADAQLPSLCGCQLLQREHWGIRSPASRGSL